MRKKQTTLPVKGIRAPALFHFCRGIVDGNFHTGGLDRENGILHSPYLIGQTNRFNACISARRERAEQALFKVWAEADQLLIDLAVNSSVLGTPSQETTAQTASSAQLRSMDRAATRQAARAKERLEHLKRLAVLKNMITAEVNAMADQVEATAHLMLSNWAAYGHGLLLKPVPPKALPVLACEDYIKQMISRHQETWDAMTAALKEVKYERI